MPIEGFRERMLSGDLLAGTFQKTPAYEIVEVLAQSGLDFVCLDAEHSAFDRARMDACLAVGRALGFPLLVRVGAATPQDILQALDSGAAGIVVPHVTSAARAAEVARWSRFGRGGRGYAGSTRWADYATRPMAELLERSARDTVVIAQIEDVEALDDVEAIAATEGIDGLFLGPADMSVAMGQSDQSSAELEAAVARIGAAARAAGKAYMSFVAGPERAAIWRAHGMTMFFIASEHSWMRAGASVAAEGIHRLGEQD